MIKEKKFITISLSLILAGAVLMGIGYFSGGFKSLSFNNNNNNKVSVSDSKDIVHERNSIDSFQNINLNTDYTDIEIVKGNKYEIETDYDKSFLDLEYSVTGDTLNITSKNKQDLSFNVELFKNHNNLKSNKIKIYIPKDSDISELKGLLGYSDINIQDLNLSSADITCNYGDIDINNMKSNGLNITSKYGNVQIKGELKGKNTLDCEYGDIDLKTLLPEKDYSYDFDVDFGDCRVDGKNREGGYKKDNASSENKITASCNYGDLKVNFK